MPDRIYTTYIISNKYNTCIYVGITNNIERRINEHRTKYNPKSFSARYNTHKLLFFQHFGSPLEAIAREKQIKRWNRNKKLQLIQIYNPKFIDLFDFALTGEEIVPRED